MALDRKTKAIIAELNVASERLAWAKAELKASGAEGAEPLDVTQVTELLATAETSIRSARETWQS